VALAARLRSLRDHGRSALCRYYHELVGTTSRLDALQAVVLNAKLPWLDAWTEARRSIAARYRAALEGSAARLVAELPGSRGGYHLAVARVADRTSVQQWLAEAGIETQLHYPIPCHHQAPFQRFATRPLPVAEESAGQVLSLPMFPHMNDDQVTRVCDAIRDVSRVTESLAASPGVWPLSERRKTGTS
jgi:dTDP-4-amino-4,6-dideoxygalactose transaminase